MVNVMKILQTRKFDQFTVGARFFPSNIAQILPYNLDMNSDVGHFLRLTMNHQTQTVAQKHG